jgi:hypothetical protein
MADFAHWATACETSAWPAGTFMAAYDGNRDAAVGNVIEADPVATALRSFMAEPTEWTGSATELLGDLSKVAGERIAKAKNWPASASALSGRIRRAATPLRKIGIEVTFGKDTGRNRSRLIQIQKTGAEDRPDRPHRPCPPDFNPVPPDGPADGADDRPGATVRSRPLKSNGADVADDADAKSTPPSGQHLDLCDHCGEVGTAADPLNPYDWSGHPDGIWLHGGCEEPWHDIAALNLTDF